MPNPQESTRGEIKKQVESSKKNGDSTEETAIIQRIEPYIQDALPKSMGSVDRFLNVCLTTLRQNPDLRNCDRASLYGALLTSAQLGLTPNTLGQSYIVPFNEKGKKKKVAQLIIGYRGMLDLARRSGNLQSCTARVVYENDEFDVDYSSSRPIKKHKPWWMTDAKGPGDVFCAYFVAELEDSTHTEIMHISELKAHKKRYVKGSTLMSDEDWYRKTVVRRAFKWLPVSTEASRAEEVDQSVAYFDEESGTVDILSDEAEDDEPDEEVTITDPVDHFDWENDKEEAKELIREMGWDMDLRQSHEDMVVEIDQKVMEIEEEEGDNPFTEEQPKLT